MNATLSRLHVLFSFCVPLILYGTSNVLMQNNPVVPVNQSDLIQTNTTLETPHVHLFLRTLLFMYLCFVLDDGPEERPKHVAGK